MKNMHFAFFIVSGSYLKKIAKATDGEYYYAKTSEDLSDVFIEFEEKINPTDKNNDGLDDKLTKLICTGEITTITGTTLFSEDEYDTILESSDYDGDGLINGEEIKIYYLNEKPFVKIISSPEFYDSDCDGYNDYEELKEFSSSPLTKNYIIDSSDFLYVNQYINFESGKANNYYLNTNIGVNAVDRYIDVVVCGGEFSIRKLIYKNMID